MLGLLNFKKTRLIYRELKAYFSILKTINQEKNKEEWKEFNLRADWIGRIYTVVSLSQEDEGEMEEVKRFKVIYSIRETNKYLEKLVLHEILRPSIEQIEGTRSYLLVYTPIFNHFSVMWLSMNIFLPIFLLFTLINLYFS